MDLARLLAAYSNLHGHRAWPRQRLLHECLRTAIRDGTLAAGTRLAASRVLAEELHVARNTVLYAYEQLASEGFVTTDRRGTVVATLAPLAPLASLAAVAPTMPVGPPAMAAPMVTTRSPAAQQAAGTTASTTASTTAGSDAGTAITAGTAAGMATTTSLSQRARNLRPVYGTAQRMGAFVPGVPALDQFPMALWRRLVDRAWRALTPAQLNYGDPCGEADLRAAIADHLRAARGVVCEAGQVFITDGAQSGLDLCLRALADAGDTVWLENPGYGGALAAARGAGLAVTGIDVDDDGIAPTADDWLLRPPRLIYTTPSHQYPVGSVLSLRRRLALIDAARAAGALIIEDDYDSEFRHDGAPLSAMQGLAPEAPVVYLGTFSKTMFPGLRIGFIVVPRALAPAFAAMRVQSYASGRAAEQLALAEFLRSGQFALHVRRMRRLYRQRRDTLVAALERHMGPVATVHGASAGMHLSLRLRDQDLDDAAISAQALACGVAVNALSRHDTHGRSGWKGLMLGYAQVPAQEMEEPVKRLATVVHLAAYTLRRQC